MIYNLGVVETHDFNQKSKIRWFNLFSFTTFLGYLCFSIALYFLDYNIASLLCGITSFLNILSYYLNYKNKYNYAIVLMSVTNISITVIISILYGRIGLTLFLQILWVLSTQYVYENKFIKNLLIFLAGCVMIFTEWIMNTYPPVYTVDNFFLYASMLIVCFIYLYLWVNSYLVTNYDYRIQLSEKNEQLSILINNIPALIYFKDINLKYVLINDLFAISLNLNYSDVIGKNDEELSLPESEFFKQIDLEVINTGRPVYNIDTKYSDYKGQLVWVSTSKVPFFNKDGKIGGIIGIVQNVSDYKNTEEKLKELNATKDKFFSIIAHDLKNPLSALMMNSELLTNYYDRFDDSERIQKLTDLFDVSKQLSKLLENLLVWSRTQSNTILFQPSLIELSEIIDESINFHNLNIANKKLIIYKNCNESNQIFADPNFLRIIFRNLISNAIKFTPNYGEIEINQYSKNNLFHFEIKDNGVGMDTETLNSLFQIDKNISHVGTNNEIGTGLGLILCKEFVEKHGGNIWVESQLGKGSSFYFTIPKIIVEQNTI